MKKTRFIGNTVRTLALLSTAIPAFAQESSRTITIAEDRDQQYMTSKVYELKHVRAHNLAPYILGAVRRMEKQSNVQSLDDVSGKKQFLVVSASKQMMPYVDQMVSMLDYPSPRVDEQGNKIEGTGISRWSYCPEYRSADAMNEALGQTFTGGFGSGAAFFDNATNMFYFKTSKSEGAAYLKFLKELDRPVPQVELVMNVYLVSENTFRELGIDYVSWKNGPGAKIFNAEWLFNKFSLGDIAEEVFLKGLTEQSGEGVAGMMGLGTTGGFLIAPNFDATFLRLLQQNGKAWSASSGTLTLVNDPDNSASDYDSAKYRFKFAPEFQTLLKDDKQSTTVESFDNAEYTFYFSTPIICFGEDKPGKGALTVMGTWNLEVSTLTEVDNTGMVSTDSNAFSSALTLQCGTEKLVAAFDKTVKVTQYNGMPFFGEIPVLKYLLGSESKVDSRMKVFITMSAKPLITANKPNPAAGKVIDTALLAAD